VNIEINEPRRTTILTQDISEFQLFVEYQPTQFKWLLFLQGPETKLFLLFYLCAPVLNLSLTQGQ